MPGGLGRGPHEKEREVWRRPRRWITLRYCALRKVGGGQYEGERQILGSDVTMDYAAWLLCAISSVTDVIKFFLSEIIG